MGKFFENMDERFNSIETELDYNDSSDSWRYAEKMLDDAFLDSSFVEASQSSSVAPIINFESIDDAFLDDAFTEASSATKANYASHYFNDFKSNEETLFQNETFVNAAQTANASYQSEYWNDANIALQNEGLHHEYKAKYWAEAEKLLVKDTRNQFFLFWSAVAGILLVFSFIGLNFNAHNNSTLSELNTNNLEHSEIATKQTLKNNKKSVNNESNAINTLVSVKEPTPKQFDTEHVVPKLNESNSTNNNSSNTTNSKKSTSVKNQTLFTHLPMEQNRKSSDNLAISNHNIVKKESINSKLPNTILLNTFKIKPQRIQLIAVKKQSESPLLIKLTSLVITPIHELGIKIEKGIGNVFTDKKTTFSSRHALYIDYRFKPVKKLNRFELGLETGAYHMNLDNLEYEQNYSVYKNHGGVDHMWAKMTYKDLIFISSSINLYYKLNSKHKIKIAVGVDKLVTSKIDMKYKSNLETIIHSNSGEWGINNGIITTDFTVGMGYEYEINSKFSFLFDSKFGTIDKTNNNYLRNTKMNRDLSILFGLKYNIFATR